MHNIIDTMSVITVFFLLNTIEHTFNSMMETMYLLKSPANAAHLSRSIEQFRKGKAKAHKLVDV